MHDWHQPSHEQITSYGINCKALCLRKMSLHIADLPNGGQVDEPAMDVPVEAPGTPVANSARGIDGLSDITVPAKAAMLEARVAELEVGRPT